MSSDTSANPSLVMRSQLCFFSLIRELADEREHTARLHLLAREPLPRAAMVMIACPLPRMTRHWDVPLPEELPAPQEWKDAGEYPEEIPFDLQELKDTCKERNVPYDERRDEEMSLRERILQDMIRRYRDPAGARYLPKKKDDEEDEPEEE